MKEPQDAKTLEARAKMAERTLLDLARKTSVAGKLWTLWEHAECEADPCRPNCSECGPDPYDEHDFGCDCPTCEAFWFIERFVMTVNDLAKYTSLAAEARAREGKRP